MRQLAAQLAKPVPAALLLVLLWSAWRLVLLWHTGIPEPFVHDEFSYLLGADTFVHGRLANPPHPLARFFESPHIIAQPVYTSKYPPGQALLLAFGQLLGSPFYGVLIGNAMMVLTFCLMLLSWVPRRWALAISGTFAICLLPPMYWTTSYWGGSLAATGGALVLLGIRLCQTKRPMLAGVVWSTGALLLLWTRPLEGGVFVSSVLLVFARELWRTIHWRTIVAAGALLTVGAVWTCYDNRAVSGNAFEFPYLLHVRQYEVTPVFWFLPPRPEPHYSHPRLASEFGTAGWSQGFYPQNASWWQSLAAGFVATLETVELPLRVPLLLLVLTPFGWRDPFFRRMAIVVGICLLGLSLETFHQTHYSAPTWAALALMMATWARRVCDLRTARHRVLVWVALGWPALVIVLFNAAILTLGLRGNMHPPDYWANRRAALINRLSADGRRQLVIVRYPSPEWRISDEWVYNGADIDSQHIIFAHDLGPEQNRALLEYYADRKVSLLTFDPVTGREHFVDDLRSSGEQRISVLDHSQALPGSVATR